VDVIRHKPKEGVAMTQTLNHALSPLEQARRARKVSVRGSSQQLSLKDQADLKQVLSSKYEFVDDKAFYEKDANKAIFDDAPPIQRPDVSWYHPVMENMVETKKLSNSPGTVLLTAAQERVLFLQFNFCRYNVVQIKTKIGDGPVVGDDARELLKWYRKAEELRDQIAQTNLALVLAMAKRFRGSELDYADLISEGNMALLRAIDKFDAAKGYKLSTYACRAILKGFSRIGIKVSRYRNLFPAAFDAKMEKSDHMDRKRQQQENDCVDDLRTIIRDNRANLTEMERKVIQHRFQIDDDGRSKPNRKKLTLEQVGKLIGVTKERVRQIQHKAYEKLRASMEADFLT
jgi:RNA polymerase primary sigma factor